MIELLLSKERKARVWFAELPIAPSPMRNSEHRLKVQGNHAPFAHSQCALELFIPLGGRFLHGLLGCTVSGLSRSEGEFVLETDSRCKELFANSLAKNVDEVHWGLDDEFAESVLSGAAESVARFGLPGKEIHFHLAAHGELGSSSSIFDRLGRLLIELALLPDTSEKGVADLLEMRLSEYR